MPFVQTMVDTMVSKTIAESVAFPFYQRSFEKQLSGLIDVRSKKNGYFVYTAAKSTFAGVHMCMYEGLYDMFPNPIVGHVAISLLVTACRHPVLNVYRIRQTTTSFSPFRGLCYAMMEDSLSTGLVLGISDVTTDITPWIKGVFLGSITTPFLYPLKSLEARSCVSVEDKQHLYRGYVDYLIGHTLFEIVWLTMIDSCA